MLSGLWYPIEDYLQAGGLVMAPLVLVSLVMWGVIVHKLLALKALYRQRPAADAGAGCPDSALDAPATAMAARLVDEFNHRRSGHAALDAHVVDEAVLAVSGGLERGLALIGVLAAIAPLLGLLGTVVGMITTFNSIALFGTGNARAMAGGISEALITTQTGLLVAIPGLYLRNFLQRRIAGLKHQLDSLALSLKRQVSQGEGAL